MSIAAFLDSMSTSLQSINKANMHQAPRAAQPEGPGPALGQGMQSQPYCPEHACL